MKDQKCRLFKNEPIFAIIDNINEWLQYYNSPKDNNHKTQFSILPNLNIQTN